jgi:hypothetical protein
LTELRNHRTWDRINGTLSVSMNPQIADEDSSLYVLLNGSTGNFSLDYTDDQFDPVLAKQRAWSSDTGYYVKILNDTVQIIRWWDGYEETLPLRKVEENPKKFYDAITKFNPRNSEGIISFAKEAFIRLRNCVQQPDNGQASLRSFMYLLAALEDNVELPQNLNREKWNLLEYDNSWMPSHEWEWLYNGFKKGTNNLAPVIKLVLRHASNRLFQEAHREATRRISKRHYGVGQIECMIVGSQKALTIHQLRWSVQ